MVGPWYICPLDSVDVTSFGKRFFADVIKSNDLKMRSSWIICVGPKFNNKCPNNTQKRWKHREKTLWNWRYASRNVWGHQTLKGKKGFSPRVLYRSMALLAPWCQTGLQNCEKQTNKNTTFSCVKPPVCSNLLLKAKKLIHLLISMIKIAFKKIKTSSSWEQEVWDSWKDQSDLSELFNTASRMGQKNWAKSVSLGALCWTLCPARLNRPWKMSSI